MSDNNFKEAGFGTTESAKPAPAAEQQQPSNQPQPGQSGYVPPHIKSQYMPDSSSSDDSAYARLNRMLNMNAVTASGNQNAGSTEEALKSFSAALSRVINAPSTLKVKLVPVEHSSLYISSICMTYTIGNVMYYVVFMLEAVGHRLSNRTATLPGNNVIEVDINTSQYWDDTMQGIVTATLESVAGLPGIVPKEAACMVIPRGIDLTNVDQISTFFDHGMAAIHSILKLANKAPTNVYTIGDLVDRSIQCVAKYEVTPGGIYQSTTGAPLAGDINMVLYVRPPAKLQENASLHGGNVDIPLAKMLVYVDFMKSDPVADYQFMGNQPKPGYNPMVVITENTCLKLQGNVNDTILSQLLALPMLMPLIQAGSYRWATVFEPYAGDRHGKASLGNLGLEHNPFEGVPGNVFVPKAIEIISQQGGPIQEGKLTAGQMASMYCTNNVIVAMDILQGGPLSWIQTIIGNATPGSKAEDIIIRELDAFSNGIFSQIWNRQKSSIVAMDLTNNMKQLKTMIHQGSFVAESARDVRSIDYLTMLEFCNGNADMFNRFATGFYPDTDDQLAMDVKRKLLQHVASNVEITGLYNRIFIDTAFISAIDAMMSQCGSQISIEGLVDLGNVSQRRTFNSNAFQPVQSHGTFSQYNRNQNIYGGARQGYGHSPLENVFPGQYRQ